ncbi:hypothetical protein [Streptomyces sp. NPDC001975]
MIRVDFSLPAEFQEIPLGGDFDVPWAEAVLPGERKPVATVSDDEWPSDEAAGAMRRVSCFLSDVGVVYAANCLQVFEGQVSLGSLAVAIVDYPYGHSAATAARGAVQAVNGSTSRVAHWEKCYAPVVAGILRSLRFTAVDGTTVNPADRAGDAHDGGGPSLTSSAQRSTQEVGPP